MSGKSGLSGHLKSSSSPVVMEQMAQGQKEMWEQDVWCSSHGGHWARGPCTSLPCHPRASAVEEALGNQHSKMAVHLPRPLSCVESMCKYGNGSHAGSSAWAQKHGLSFPGLTPCLLSLPRYTLQSRGHTLTMSALFQHWRGSVLIPSEWIHILGQICPPACTASTCITSYRLTECCFHDYIVPQKFPPPLGQTLQQRKDRSGFVPREFLDFTSHPHDLGFYLLPSWPHPHYQLSYNTL